MSLRIIVPGKPKGKGRARFGNGRTYTPEKTVAYEGLIALAGQKVMDGAPIIERPVYLIVTAFFAYPKAWTAKRIRERPIHWHTGRPDGDNILKAVGDGLNGIVWRDDSCIALAKISKQYSDSARLEIIVEPL